jgi:hypothetical protein
MEKYIIIQIIILNLLSRHPILKLFPFYRIFYIRFRKLKLEKHGIFKLYSYFLLHFFSWFDKPSGLKPRRCRCYNITFTHNTLGRTPLDKWSARCRYVSTTSHNTYKRKRSIPRAGFEPANVESDWPQTLAVNPLLHIWICNSMQIL